MVFKENEEYKIGLICLSCYSIFIWNSKREEGCFIKAEDYNCITLSELQSLTGCDDIQKVD